MQQECIIFAVLFTLLKGHSLRQTCVHARFVFEVNVHFRECVCVCVCARIHVWQAGLKMSTAHDCVSARACMHNYAHVPLIGNSINTQLCYIYFHVHVYR